MAIDSKVLPASFLKCMAKTDRPRGPAGMLPAEAFEAAAAGQEGKLQDLIAVDLGRRGIAHTKARRDRKSTISVGWPDFTICYRGRFVGIEIKTVEGKLDEDQVKALALIRAEPNNGLGLVARSLMDVHLVLQILEAKPDAKIEDFPLRMTRLDQ